eukprot:6288436-Alexandrium_andersonii.AAC.1
MAAARAGPSARRPPSTDAPGKDGTRNDREADPRTLPRKRARNAQAVCQILRLAQPCAIGSATRRRRASATHPEPGRTKRSSLAWAAKALKVAASPASGSWAARRNRAHACAWGAPELGSPRAAPCDGRAAPSAK